MDKRYEDYIKKIERDLRGGKATEYTYRGTLELLIESMANGIQASNDPKHIAVGAPDFIVEKRKVPLGYIETKDVGADLNAVEKSEQMKRYLKGLHNLILTDYIEFRWYVNGVKRLTAHLATKTGSDRLVFNPLGAEVTAQMLQDFLTTETATVNTPKELAERLAGVTHFIKEQIEMALEEGDAEVKQALEAQYKVFVELLLPALTHREFADLYAQTVTYGLFAAKVSAPEGGEFSLEDAYKYLRRIPFLRRLFQDVNEQLDEIDIIKPYLQDIVSLLNRTDMTSVLADFGKRTRTEDPIVHFYETFLAKYDPKLRESRGVYYTPEPVVQFIVRSVDEILKTRFNKPWGLADGSVKVLDPAAGTGTFLYYVIQQIHNEVVNVRGQGGQWAEKSKEVLKRIYGFELLMPPYVMSHLKLGMLMDELGAPLEGKDERVHVYLTNTLEEGKAHEGMLPSLGWGIAQESSEAAKVKQADDIMVVLGNPPYSAVSGNTGEWITNLIRNDYYPHDEIKEHNPKLLLDDYVKFIKYGEWRISKTGQGVLAFITNHGYIDNPTFRGMRQHLMQTFDEIYVLDLHGNSKKKETTPDGSKDENVFDIQQGVAIFIGIKKAEGQPSAPRIRHCDLWGLREEKYNSLFTYRWNTIDWGLINPAVPFFLLKPQDDKNLPEYNKGWKITDIFPVSSTGIKTHHDDFVFDFDKDSLINRINKFTNLSISDEAINKAFDFRESTEWNLKKIRILVSDSKDWKDRIITCSYRPFDNRFLFYDTRIIVRAREEVFQHFLSGSNLSLLFMRQVAVDEGYTHFFVSEFPTDNRGFYSNKGALSAAPLYLYRNADSSKLDLFSSIENQMSPNLSPHFIREIHQKLGLTLTNEAKGDIRLSIGPEDILYYIYGIVHSPTYRTRYAEFLKIDFPRVPLTSDKKLFAALVKKGRELVDLHLLKSAKVDNFITTYPVSGENVLEKVRYEDGKVWINKTQYFGGVPEAVWQFKIGGYQVCDKWLKDRKGRVLSAEDVSHYQRVVVALHETIRVMQEIDAVIPKWPIE